MKKTKILVMTLAMTLCSAATAYAHLPYDRENGFLLVGNKAYSIYYLSTLNSGSADLKAINDSILHYINSVYWVNTNSSGSEQMTNINNMTNPQIVSNESQIKYIVGNDPITYIGANSTTVYSFNSDSSYNDYEPQTLRGGNAYVDIETISDMKILKISINTSSLQGLNETPVYFQIEDSSQLAKIGETISCLINKNKDYEQIKILSSDKRVLASGNVKINGLTGSSYQPLSLIAEENQSTGNTVSNINNGGYAATDGLWIYYSNTADGGKLYKVKIDGQDNQIISNDKASYINVLGNEIYYCNVDDNSKIYKINSEGLGRTKVCDDMAAYLTISESYIYYSNHSNGGSLSRVPVYQQGGNGTIITSDNASFINVSGDRIYYSNNSDSKKIYAIDSDGLCRTCISDSKGALGCGANYVTLGMDGYIYYTNYNEGNKIYKIKTDGSEDKQVSSTSANAFNLYGINDIYYSNYSDGGKIYKIETDGTGNKSLGLNDAAQMINIVNNSIYYTKSGKLSVASPIDGSSAIKSVAVTKPQLPGKIQKINNLTDVVSSFDDSVLATYQFPDKVPVIMDDNSIKEIVVNWDKTKPSKTATSCVYTGTLLGYGNKVTLTLTLTTSINAQSIVVNNTGGVNDTVTVTGLKPGDIVNVYKDSNLTNKQIMGSAQVPANSDTAVVNLKLDQSKNSVWVSLIANSSNTESTRVEAKYLGLTTESITASADNENGPMDSVKVYGEQPGDIIKIYKDSTSTSPINGSNGTKVVKLDSDGSITIDSLDFGQPQSGNVYVTVTSPGKSESKRITVSYSPSPNVTAVNTATDYLRLTDSGDINYKYSFDYALKGAGNADIGNVTKDINLPTSIQVVKNGITEIVDVSWSSDSANVTIMGNMAIIHRPAVGSASASANLTANLSDSDESVVVKNLESLTIPAVSAADALTLDEQLIPKYVRYAQGDSQTSVTQDFTLPTKGQNGSTIKWNPSGDTAITINGNYATVTRPESGYPNKTVTLTATVTNGSSSDSSYKLSVTIIAKSGTDYDLSTAKSLIEALDKSEFYYGSTSNLENLIAQLQSEGIAITWDSSYPDIISGKPDGSISISRPDFTNGTQPVSLTATLSKNNQTLKVNPITVNVDTVPATPIEFVDAVSGALNPYIVTLGKQSGMTQLYLPLSSYDTQGATLKVSPFYKSGDLTYVYSAAKAGDKKASITWTCDNAELQALIDSAKSSSTPSSIIDISKLADGTKITLTATITCDNSSTTKMILLIISK